MNKERELLRQALDALNDREAQLKKLGWGCLTARALEEDIRTYLSTTSDDAEESEAEPVLYIKEQELLYIQVLKQEGLAQEWKSNLGFVKEDGDVGLYLHPPKPADIVGEMRETLKAENFKLASGQCTEGGPWGDEGGTPYCKYAKRKPMDDDL